MASATIAETCREGSTEASSIGSSRSDEEEEEEEEEEGDAFGFFVGEGGSCLLPSLLLFLFDEGVCFISIWVQQQN